MAKPGPDTTFETVVLERIGKPTDLWPAVESAQFARVIIHEETDDGDDEQAIDGFIDVFTALVEAWDTDESRNRSFMFDGVEAQLRLLERRGWFVHYGCIERSIGEQGFQDTAVVPVAVIRIGQSPNPSTTVRLPNELNVDEETDDAD